MTAKWEGLSEVQQDLIGMTAVGQGAALRAAMRAATSVVRKAAVARAPSRRVKRSLISVVKGRDGVVVGQVGPKRGTPGAKLLHLLEKDTKPRTIAIRARRGKKVLANRKQGIFFGRVVQHPGTTGQHFFQPVLEEMMPEAQRKFASALRKVATTMKLRRFVATAARNNG